MYLDKPMRDHKLLQAIARTNRPYPGKAAGIIVDYVGIFDKLKKALNFQEQDIEGLAFDYDVLKEEFSDIIAAVLKPFSGVVKDGSRDSLFSALAVLKDEVKHKSYKQGLSKLRSRYETIAPDPFLLQFENEYAWLIEVNVAYNKLHRQKIPDLSEYQEKTKRLIREKLLVEKLEKDLPLIEIDKDYLQKVDSHKFTKRQKAMEVAEAARNHIRINVETNPIYETLSHRLERILKVKETAQLFEELESLVQEIVEVDARAQELGLSKEEYAFLNVVKNYLSNRSENDLTTFVKELDREIKTMLFLGWHRKVKMATEVEQKLFDSCFWKYGDDLDMKQLASLSEELMNFIADTIHRWAQWRR